MPGRCIVCQDFCEAKTSLCTWCWRVGQIDRSASPEVIRFAIAYLIVSGPPRSSKSTLPPTLPLLESTAR
jgi:hypothetical protein